MVRFSALCMCVQNRKERPYFLCLYVFKVLNEFSKKETQLPTCGPQEEEWKQTEQLYCDRHYSSSASLPSQFPDVQTEGSVCFRTNTKPKGLTNYETSFILLNFVEHTLSP
jgi:hypothetical protein